MNVYGQRSDGFGTVYRRICETFSTLDLSGQLSTIEGSTRIDEPHHPIRSRIRECLARGHPKKDVVDVCRRTEILTI